MYAIIFSTVMLGISEGNVSGAGGTSNGYGIRGRSGTVLWGAVNTPCMDLFTWPIHVGKVRRAHSGPPAAPARLPNDLQNAAALTDEGSISQFLIARRVGKTPYKRDKYPVMVTNTAEMAGPKGLSMALTEPPQK